MHLLNYIKTLGYGVLKNTSYSLVSLDGDETELLSLVTLIDDGLTRLYSRFCLRERHLIMEMQVGVTFYHFNKKYTVQNGDKELVPRPYIKDLPNDPFDEDVIKVLRVNDSTGSRRPVDDPNNPKSVFMVQYDVMHNPYPREGEALYITYQAKHVPLLQQADDSYELHSEILLPPILEPALTNYIGYLVNSQIGSQEAMAKAANYLNMYAQICEDVDRMDLVNGSKSATNERFKLNGWT